MRIDDPDMIEQIEENVDLLEYVSDSIELQKKGNDYFGHCPLHVDRTPSFSITPDKNNFFCFGCGKGGRIINYLYYYEGLSYDESIQKAARLGNTDLSKMCKSETMAYLKKNKRATLETVAPVHEFLDESKLSKYRQGEIPLWENEGILKETLKEFQILIDDNANRIVYPVRDIKGRLINIKGRTMFANYKKLKLMKYINYFKIGEIDYFQSLDKTLPYVLEKKEIIIFESIKSVMKIWQWGYKNGASAENHNLSVFQIKLLAKLKVNIVFAYDCDVDYFSKEVKKDIDKLKRITNVYLIENVNGALGTKEDKNSPADCGKDVWEFLYENKRKIV